MELYNEENLIDNNKEQIELKEIVNTDEDEISKKEKEENIEEVKQNIVEEETQEKSGENTEKPQKEEEEENILNDNKKQNDKDEPESEDSEPIGKKEIEAILLIMNPYWINLFKLISLIITILLYEILAHEVLEIFKDIDNFEKSLEFILDKLGLKWLYFLRMGAHLSVGFFCLSTFTSIMKDTKDIKKFIISNLIKIVIYYAVTIVILKVILDGLLRNFFISKMQQAEIKNERVEKIFNDLVDKLMNLFLSFLSMFNTFLEEFVFGAIYIFLFNKPKRFTEKKMIYFRLLVIIPILYIIVSLVLRGLHNAPVIKLNAYVLSLLLGSKITIYIFFISTLSIIKYLSLKYEVFDKENEINPRVFTKIGSRCFSILGIIELIIGLFLPSWSKYGIGGTYLLILCAPIMTLYDYKKNYQLKYPCYKEEDMSLCVKIVVLIVGWSVVIALGVDIFIRVYDLFNKYFYKIVKFIIDNFELVIMIMNLFLK